MTAAEIRDQVTKKYREGQTVTIRVNADERGNTKPVKAKIIKFNPFSVLTERNGFKESYGYLEFLQCATIGQQGQIVIPEKFRRTAAGI